ncbi:MAG: 3-oxoacid CoA-transferase subunit A [Planctomycetota bacterium]|jgi:acetate CoA/acetoacetate CoA-transferase alpha subunit|nr:3-oxoacid CoA-transferase subunit A [Planctomycetota bacterium]
MAQILSAEKAVSHIKDGMSVMVGGFMGCGTAHTLVDRLAKSGVKDLTLICNDGGLTANPVTGEELYGVIKLIHNGQIKRLIASHVGLTPEVGQRMNDGTLEVTLIPQGSFAEMIRAGGAGLGGILTPTGCDTIIEKESYVHSAVEIDGRRYLLKRPLRADVALISGHTVDASGNVWYKGTTRTFNHVMATAADLVIVEADHLVGDGDIIPENVITPGILVDYIVKGDESLWKKA